MATKVEGVTVRLRGMIVAGEIPAGGRVLERELADLLGVSRTPVRVALGVLETEGLVRGEPNRSFVVNAIGIDDVLSAYEVRGVLDGLAARTAAETGLSPQAIHALEASVAEGAELVASGIMRAEEMRRWSDANKRFHETIVAAANLPALGMVQAFLSRTPLAAPGAILFTGERPDLSLKHMTEAHNQHVQVLGALCNGEGARAEHLMREHAHSSRNNLAPLLRARVGVMSAEDAAAGRRMGKLRAA